MAKNTINYGVTFTPEGAESKHTLDDWGCWFSAAPAYSSRTRKENIISIPFSNSVLDFSDMNGRYYYDESQITYSIVYQAKGNTNDEKISDMKNKQSEIENYIWNFKGSVSDDYVSPKKMENSRCISFEVTPNLGAGVLEMVFTMQGEYLH